jgi:DNA (cytosine-5)-methyltransferase 1
VITYGSICSGIEAASVAWHPLGWRAEWFAEIEPFPSAVLAYRWPEVSNLGDMTKLARQVLAGTITAPDVLVGGTPCQAFSVAGMRAGLDDPRGQLTIKYVELADAVDHVRPAGDECVIVWENVPGVLSDKGNAFGCFLGALVGESDALQPSGGKWTDAGCVYGPRRAAAWRVLDAQYFGLAQRRRRVFVVASARAGFDPAAVLFESEGMRRDHPPRRGEGENPTGTIAGGARRNGGYSTDDIPLTAVSLRAQAQCSHREDSETFIPVAFGGNNTSGPIDIAPARNACGSGSGRMDFESEAFIVSGTLQANGKAAGSATQQDAESGLLVVHGTQDPCVDEHIAHALGRNHGQENAVLAFAENSRAEVRLENGDGQIVGALSTGGGKAGQGTPCIAFSCKDYGNDATSELSPTLRAMGHGESHANAGGQVAVVAPTLRAGNPRNNSNPVTEADMLVAAAGVRRLTPRECESLQGFPDDYTLIPWRGKPAEECPDGPRYKAIGNSKAVPVVRWIGRRIQRELERAQ